MKYFLITIILNVFFISVSGTRNDGKSSNLYLERPAKHTGLLEKPIVEEGTVDTENVNESEDSTWFRRLWQKAFGRQHPQDMSEDISHESGLPGFFVSLRPWWKGPNVCNYEDETNVSDSNESGSSILSFFLTSCQDSGRSYKCTRKSRRNTTTIRVHTLTYECCWGYTREDMQTSGCPIKLQARDMITTLRDLNATKLAEAIGEANLNSTLEKRMLTLFAPSDDAMTSGGQDISVVVLETIDKMQFTRDILRSHFISSSKAYSWDDFEDESILLTESIGSTIRINIFTRPEPFATANCARILSSDHQTTNGYVHIIDRVLNPVTRNLWQIIEDDPRFSIFRTLIDDNIKRRLTDSHQHLTLLAFTDDAFENLPEDIRRRIRDKSDCFRNLILHHLLPHTICSTAIYDDRGYVRNLAGRLINATRTDNDILSIDGRKVISTDQMATNGVMHVVDDVILAPEMLDVVNALDRISGASQFSRALKSNGVSELLSNAKTATVFVPPSDIISFLDSNDLRNHIVHESIFDRFRVILNRPLFMTTEAKKNVSVRFEYEYAPFLDWNAQDRLRLHVGCAKAQKIVSACNGAVIFLDKALPLPTKTVYDLLKSKPEFSDFVSMIDSSKLTDDFKNDDFDGTVLAPSNEALNIAFSPYEKSRLISNQQRLKRFVKEHVIHGTKCCNELSTNNDWFTTNTYSTMAGTELSATGNREIRLTMGGARVITCDLVATNGLVHEIASVVVSRPQWRWPQFWNRHL